MGKPLKRPGSATASRNTLLDASVPDMSYYESYISRDILPGLSEFDIFDKAHEARDNVLIEGPTGPGKTSAVLAYAALRKKPFYAVPSNVGIEPSQLFGKYIPATDGGFVWVDGPVTKIVRNGGVLLINEVNFIPERVATVLFGLLDKRRQIVLLDHKAETITAADDLLIVADMNPDYEGTRPLNKAFRNRFAHQLWWDYDPNVEAALVNMPDLLKMAHNIRSDAAEGAYETPVSTNMLMEFERIALAVSLDYAMLNFQNHFAADERPVVKVVLDTFQGNLEADLNRLKAEHGEGETLESQYPEDHPIWDQRMNEEDGWEDPEWGIKGSDWVFSD